MRAAVYHGRQDIRLGDVPEPQPGPGEVKISIASNGICGSNLHEYFGGRTFIPASPHPVIGKSLPLTLGHEFAGTVVEVGADAEGVREGDRVAVRPMYVCGTCGWCRHGRRNVCQNFGFQGLIADGGLAERCVVPASMLHPLPDNVSLEPGALVEPMAVGYHAATLGQVEQDGTAVVFGAGPVGIAVWFALRALGVRDVVVVEPAPARRTAIEARGAMVLNPEEVDVVDAIMQRTGGRGADAAFDAAGVSATVLAAVNCLAPDSPLVAVALYSRPVETDLTRLLVGEARIQGSLAYTSHDFDAVIALMASGHYNPKGWVDHVGLDHLVEVGIPELKAGRRIKLLVDPSH